MSGVSAGCGIDKPSAGALAPLADQHRLLMIEICRIEDTIQVRQQTIHPALLNSIHLCSALTPIALPSRRFGFQQTRYALCEPARLVSLKGEVRYGIF